MDDESQARMGMESERGLALGAQFMAVTFDALLCGVALCQCLRWLPNYNSDRLLIRIVVAFGALAGLGTTCFTWGVYMRAFVRQYGKFAAFADLKFFGVYPLLDILTVVPVQLVFADRSRKINNRNLAITIANYGFIVLTAACAISITALSRHHTIYDKPEVFKADHKRLQPADIQALKAMMVLWPAVCTMTHLILTGSILYGLYRTREGANQTRQMLDRIIFMSLESQAPGTIFAFTAMVVIAADVDSPFIPWIVIVHPKVFLIGCLAMINVRHTWQRQGKLPTTLESHSHGRTDYRQRSQRSSGSAPSDTVGTPPNFDTAKPGVIMLATSFDDDEGPGMQLSELGKAIELDDKKALEGEDYTKDPIASLKVDHMA